MSKKTFKLSIRTPEGDVFDSEATSIRLRAENGQLQVFANHASLLATVIFSRIVVDTPEGEKVYLGRRGIFNFNNDTNTATLLTLYCEEEGKVDLTNAEDYLKFIEEQMAQGKDLSDFHLTYLEGEKLAIQQQIAHQN
jgi:F0F1-type ATP synthase epsilon subunit